VTAISKWEQLVPGMQQPRLLIFILRTPTSIHKARHLTQLLKELLLILLKTAKKMT
jgi:hypothetical protein